MNFDREKFSPIVSMEGPFTNGDKELQEKVSGILKRMSFEIPLRVHVGIPRDILSVRFIKDEKIIASFCLGSPLLLINFSEETLKKNIIAEIKEIKTKGVEIWKS
ncbi:hypothetical protein KKH36_01160 [Patescibacteria group bacterium]|nr:hypothetical protein [Patescibacteria group bacterium]